LLLIADILDRVESKRVFIKLDLRWGYNNIRIKKGNKYITNFIWTITPGILDQFQQSKWTPKALKKTFQTVPKTSQSDQYSLSYQQISQ